MSETLRIYRVRFHGDGEWSAVAVQPQTDRAAEEHEAIVFARETEPFRPNRILIGIERHGLVRVPADRKEQE